MGKVRMWAVALAVVAMVAACTAGEDGAVSPRSADLGEVVLVSFDACDELLRHLRAEGGERVGPWGLPDQAGPVSIMPVATDAAVAEGRAAGDEEQAASAAPPAGGGASGQFSGTNIQEQGVDEPDLVKTDGRRIVTVTDGRLHVIDVTGEARRTGSVEIAPGGNHELLLHGDRALVLANGSEEPADGPAPGPVLRDEIGIAPTATPRAVLTEVDLSDPAQPRVAGTLEIDGGYVSARQVGTTARVVVRSSPSLPFVHPTGETGSEDVAETANRRIVAGSDLDDWLPAYRLTSGEQSQEGRLHECSSVSRPSEFSGFGTISVLTVALDEPLGDGDATGILAGGETVYASTGTLYVATHRWSEQPPVPQPAGDVAVSPAAEDDGATDLHSFDISVDGPAAYLASGSVPGRLLNQFSLSEHEGRLRVATTEGAPRNDTDRPSESAVVVLERQGDRLVEVGRVGGLGKTETIHAVRFIGDLGYVVTFRRTDPLYVVDLSDPAAPRVAGELKIPGYSAYLHPVGDGLLLGVGQDATEDGRVTGSQVSLFDVSDPSKPTRLHQHDLGGGSSEVELDHRAFLWWEPSSIAVLPLQRYDVIEIPVEPDAPASGEATGPDDPGTDPVVDGDRAGVSVSPPAPPHPFVGAVGITVGREAGLAAAGEITHAAHVDEPWAGQIRRTIVVDDRLFTFSQGGVLVSDLATLAERGWIPLT